MDTVHCGPPLFLAVVTGAPVSTVCLLSGPKASRGCRPVGFTAQVPWRGSGVTGPGGMGLEGEMVLVR